MIILKTAEQIEKMKKAGDILAAVHREIRKMIKPGVTTKENRYICRKVPRRKRS